VKRKPVVALLCGHTVCKQHFKRLGGKYPDEEICLRKEEKEYTELDGGDWEQEEDVQAAEEDPGGRGMDSEEIRNLTFSQLFDIFEPVFGPFNRKRKETGSD
jgi:hypothetical protein